MTYLTLFISIGLVSLSLLISEAGRIVAVKEKMQTVADASVLCSLRMRVEALETLARRWKEFGVLFGPVVAETQVELPSAYWGVVETKALQLKNAIPGYQGRTTAIIKVVAEANGYSREDISVEDGAAARLGVVAEPLIVRDEHQNTKILQGGWLRRTWDGEEIIQHQVGVKNAEAAVFHDAFEEGNGGFPQNWSAAIWNGRLDPFHWPVFRAGLVER